MKTNTPLFLSALFALAANASAQSTIHTTNKYAHGANTGWMNFRPSAVDGAVAGEAFLSGNIYAANFGWIHVGDGSPANGHTYTNSSGSDIGVNHDGAGNLGGYGYSGNIGWVNFGWTTANDPNRPHFDLLTGQFSGYAYSANTGWINLAGNLTTDTLASPDTDSDGMADAWEIQKFGNLTMAGIGTDKDHDGQSDAAEYAADTNPNQAGEHLRVISQTFNASITKVTLQFTTTRPTRTYHIQTSTALLNGGAGDWVTCVADFVADPGTSTTKTFSFTGGPKRFFRVVAQKPL
jgi:hypothetical protein